MAVHQMLRRSLSSEKRSAEVPKGHFAVYVGEYEKKRFIIPVSYLNHHSFQELLFRAEEEYGFHHSMGGLTIPCSEDLFIDLTSRSETNMILSVNENGLSDKTIVDVLTREN
ncbi:SAUR-like auxin-responsive protein family [Striga asiatica]|uniref:SAUR-like auxin-responsive protein family n=1 Tax=Striga asiatica TaxID=4170 RepID=A0A5A7QAQ0_STRAF|nr:SAUR-like auxin-responsive protein family [Striga asiatica]